ncbi:hypothetical protein [Halosolutus halophilus]|uniref:hypothetical protein n=1 Tax=Halosolutus halophilus TaxID=1552990 RepID=UPI002234F16F|nr:hypothetical protein [Halosolutus halophilus]
MSTLASALRSSPLRSGTARGRSGKLLVGAGLGVLTLGMTTDTLGRRVAVAGWQPSVLELGVLLVGAAVVVAFGQYLLGKLKRAAGYGLLGSIGLGIGLPGLIALPAVGGIARRLGSTVYVRIPWIGPSRWERALAAVGGPRGLVSGGYGTTLLAIGASTGKLHEVYVVFGNRLSLLAVFILLTAPGIVVYYLRR